MAKRYDVSNRDIYFHGQKAKYTGEYSSKHYWPDGYGTAILENGDKFKGRFEKGKPVIGRYTYENGSYVDIYYEYVWFTKMTEYYTHYDAGHFGYQGDKNRPNVRVNYNNGYYVGEMKNGYRDGIGTYYWNDGDKYSGGWKNGEKHGIGKFTYSNGNEYWFLYDKGVQKYTLDEPNTSTSSSSSYDDTDYDSSYSTSDDDGPSQARQDAVDRAIDAYNRGDYESAARDIKFARDNGYDSDFSITDEYGHTQDLEEFEEDIEDHLNDNDDDDQYEDE